MDRQLTLAYRPQANGIVERDNQEIMKHLRALVFDFRVNEEWSLYVPLVQRILNASTHSAIGIAPAQLLFGDRVQLNRGLLVPFDTNELQEVLAPQFSTSHAYVEKLVRVQERLIKRSKEFQESVIAKRLAGSPEEPLTFVVGDYVLLSYPTRPPTKLTPRWRGPFIVVDVDGNTYSIQDLCSKGIQQVDVSRLKFFGSALTAAEIQELASRDMNEHVVEMIIDHSYSGAISTLAGKQKRAKKTDFDFKVRWLGFGPEYDSWIPYQEARDLEALDDYLQYHPELAKSLGEVV